MPSCPECGLDVDVPGLCDECKELKKRRNNKIHPSKAFEKTRSVTNNNFTPSQILTLIVIGLIIGVFCTGISFLLMLNFAPAVAKSDVSEIASNNFPENEEITEEAVTSKESGIKVLATPVTNDTTDLLGTPVPNARLDPPVYDITKRKQHPPLDSKDKFVEWNLANRKEKEFYVSWRWDCLRDLIKWKTATDPQIQEAFLLVPRENFIRKQNVRRAYEHAYMPIGYGSTITDPWVVSAMTTAIKPAPDQKVLEIGTGSGYQSALLAQLTNYVYTIEVIDVLARETDELYKKLEPDYPEYKNIKRVSGDGYYGWEEQAPFDRIIVTCAIDHIPPPLLRQLVPEGIMVIPVGPPSGQRLLKVTKHKSGNSIWFDREDIFVRRVHFIPFTNTEGESHQAVQ